MAQVTLPYSFERFSFFIILANFCPQKYIFPLSMRLGHAKFGYVDTFKDGHLWCLTT